jgi:hypothetical protein
MINYGNRVEFDNIIKNTDGEQLRKIFIYFKIMHLYKREILEYKDIEKTIQTYSALKVNINDLIKFLTFFSHLEKEK